jgi:transposase
MRRAIAGELGLSYRYVCWVLGRAGRQCGKGRERPGMQAWIAQLYAQSAPKIEIAAAMERDGASLAEIGKAIGLTESAAHKLLHRARQDGRLPPRLAKKKRAEGRRAKAIRLRVLELDDTGHTRQEIATLTGLTYSYTCGLLSQAGRKLPPGVRHPTNEHRRLSAMRATYAAKEAILREKMLALDGAGYSRAEIASAVGLSYKHVCHLMCRFGRPASRVDPEYCKRLGAAIRAGKRVAANQTKPKASSGTSPLQGELPF